jgi:hypothetical protein
MLCVFGIRTKVCNGLLLRPLSIPPDSDSGRMVEEDDSRKSRLPTRCRTDQQIYNTNRGMHARMRSLRCIFVGRYISVLRKYQLTTSTSVALVHSSILKETQKTSLSVTACLPPKVTESLHPLSFRTSLHLPPYLHRQSGIYHLVLQFAYRESVAGLYRRASLAKAGQSSHQLGRSRSYRRVGPDCIRCCD